MFQDIPELQGEIFPVELIEADFSSECVPGLNVCVYTSQKRLRTWVGRVESRADETSFYMRWFVKKTERNVYYESDLSLDIIDDASVILWGFGCNQSSTSFEISSYYKLRIREMYSEHDKSLKP